MTILLGELRSAFIAGGGRDERSSDGPSRVISYNPVDRRMGCSSGLRNHKKSKCSSDHDSFYDSKHLRISFLIFELLVVKPLDVQLCGFNIRRYSVLIMNIKHLAICN